MTLPSRVRDEVLAELARQMDAIRWEELSSVEASQMYDRFMKAPRIGGRLADFMSPGKIRVWIKDGPAKEYRRALEGKGYLAPYTARAYPGADAIVRSALGSGWTPRTDSIDEKPMRCFAVDEDGRSVFIIWGPATSLQNLIWHAALVRADDPRGQITIVLTKATSSPLEDEEWAWAERLARVVKADCRQVTYAVGRKPNTS